MEFMEFHGVSECLSAMECGLSVVVVSWSVMECLSASGQRLRESGQRLRTKIEEEIVCKRAKIEAKIEDKPKRLLGVEWRARCSNCLDCLVFFCVILSMPGLLEGVLAAAKARTAAALVKPVVKPNVSKTEVKPKAVVTPKTPSKAGTPKPIAGTLNAVPMAIEQLKSKA